MATLVEVGLANAVVAAVLALVALLVGACSRRPALVHALWLLVLLKLVTPPLFHLSIPGLRAAPVAVVGPNKEIEGDVMRAAVPVVLTAPPTRRMPFSKIGEIPLPPMGPEIVVAPPPAPPVMVAPMPEPVALAEEEEPESQSFGALDLLGVIWGVGAILFFALALWRILAFQRLLRHAKPASPELEAEVAALCKQMGMSRVPGVWMVPGPLPPLVWSLGTARLFLPSGLMGQLEAPGRIALLVHELAHIKRRDHWARWLELLASGLFWWYPVVWMARARLHDAEEECCDAWVLSELPGYGASYAGALLETVDFLSRKSAPLPRIATGFGRMHQLKRRLKAIIQSPLPRSVSRLGWGLLLLVAIALPLGLVRSAVPAAVVEEEAKPAAKAEAPKIAASPVAVARKIPRDPPSYETASKVLGSNMGGEVWALALSPDESILAVVTGGSEGEGALTLFDFTTGKELACLVEPKPIRCVAYSPDGKWLATGDFENKIKLRDPKTGAVRAVLEGHSMSVNGVAFTGDSSKLVSGSLDKTIKVWDIATKKVIRTITGHTDWVLSVAVSKDGKTILSGSKDNTARLWNLATGAMIHELKGHGSWIEGVALSPDGTQAATASHDSLIKVWSVATGKETASLAGHTGIVDAVLFSPDGKKVYSSSHDRTVRRTSLTGEQEIFINDHVERIYGLAVTKDEKTIVSGAWDRTVKIRDMDAETVTDTFRPRRYAVETTFPLTGLVVSPDGKSLAVFGEEKMVKIVDSETGRLIHLLDGHEDVIGGVAFSPDGTLLATGGFDGVVILWDLKTGKLLRRLEGHTNWVFDVAFSPDGEQLASGGYDRAVRLWDVKTGKPIAVLLKHKGGVRCVAYSPKGGILATAGTDKTIRIWDLSKKEEVQAIKGHEDIVRALVFSPDGERIATGSEDGTARLWSLDKGKELASYKQPPRGNPDDPLPAIHSLVFSPGGTLLLMGDRTAQIKVLNAKTLGAKAFLNHGNQTGAVVAVSPDGRMTFAAVNNQIRTWPAAAPRQRPLISRAGAKQTWFNLFSPDGKWIASGGDDERLEVRSALSDRLAAKVTGEIPAVYGSALSPDGKTLALGLHDGVILLVDPVTMERKKRLEGHKFRVWSLAWSPDGKRLLSGAGKQEEPPEPGEVRIWDAESGKMLHDLAGPRSSVQAVAWSRDGKWIAFGARDGSAYLYDAVTYKEKFAKTRKEAVRSIAFHPDSTRLAVGSNDGQIGVITIEAGITLEIKGPTSGINCLDYSPDGSILAVVPRPGGRLTNPEVWLYRRDDKGVYAESTRLKGHTGALLSLAWSRDGKSLASGGGTYNTAGEVIVWDVKTLKPRLSLLAHTQWVETLTFDASGERVISAGGSAILGGEAFSWNLGAAGGWTIPEAHKGVVSCAVWSPDSKVLVTGGYDRSLKVWDAATGKLVSEWKDVHKGNVRTVAFSKDGKRLVTTGQDKLVRIWDFETRELDKELPAFEIQPASAVFSPDGKWLAVGVGDPFYKVKTGSVHIYDTATWEERADAEWSKQQTQSVAFSPDGKRLAVGGAGSDNLQIYDFASGKRLRQIKGASSIRCVQFSPDGRFLASSHSVGSTYGDGSIAVWEVETGLVESILLGHRSMVLSLAYGPDGRLGSAGNDGTLKMWGSMRSTPVAQGK